MVRTIAALLWAVWLLSGCSGMITVDNDVQAYSTLPGTPAPATYRFEWLPSQQVDAPRQARLEAIARQALAGVGMQLDDTNPAYSVQIDVSVQRLDPPPWGGAWPGWGFPGRYIVTPRGQVVWLNGFGGFGGYDGFYNMPYYLRSIRLTLRNLATSRIVFETDARQDGPWANTDAILPAMFDAALRGFPNPPQGPRQVQVQIPG
jgi:hypothetical protein